MALEESFRSVEDATKRPGISAGAAVSLVLHAGLLAIALIYYAPDPPKPRPRLEYVELVRGRPDTEPLAKRPRARNNPTRNQTPSTTAPSQRKPPQGPVETSPRIATRPEAAFAQPLNTTVLPPAPETQARPSPGSVAPATQQASPSKQGPVDWNSAIREAGRGAGGGRSAPEATSGEAAGFAESGPVTFESEWFDWSEYGDSMVARIRRNWYDNMPNLIRMGIKGVVTLRFTIQRDGRITDLVTITSSGIPPYDFAARKAIELSSPLKKLPDQFPNASERVTVLFYYNLTPPSRRP